jgi:type I restriction enzyme S subunit
MNAERLLAHYERIADAPDAIARLRRFILDLAVRGKLVPQDAKDEPVSKLLKKIAKEKAQLVGVGGIRKFIAPSSVEIDNEPFDVPRSWQWVKLGDILTKLTDGTHHSPPNAPTGDFKYITAKNIKNEGILLDDISYVPRKVHDEIYSRCNPERGDILYIKDGATTGVVTINDLDEPFSMLSSVALLKLPRCIYNRIIVLFLRSPFFYDQMRGFMKGAAIPRVTLKRMAPALVPLPPLAEQHRIVAKVDELMALCDRLEVARAEREATRDRLAAASLARLNTPDPATFQAGARFALSATPALTTRPDQIKQLRQTILNLAVQGKLAMQDLNDEAAATLLKRIDSGWSEVVPNSQEASSQPEKEGKGRYKLPSGWEWALIEHCFSVSGGIQKTPARMPRTHAFPYLGVGNVYRGRLELATVKQFELLEGELEKYRLNTNDILVVEGNGSANEIGRCAVWRNEIENCVHQNHLIRCRPLLASLTPYAELYLNSPYGVAEMKRLAITSAGLFSLSVGKIRKIPLPLPPLAEQHRIVAKVDALMKICDQLEASLDHTATIRRRLLDALLAEALAPASILNREEAA